MKSESKKLKRIFLQSLLCLVILGFCENNIFALDLLGPPVSDIQKWQANIGVDYSHSSVDMQLVNGEYLVKTSGQDDISGELYDLSLDSFETDRMNAYFGYGIERNWEAFVRLGASSSNFDNSPFKADETFDSDYMPSIGGGLRMTLVNSRDLIIGSVVQVGWTKYSGQLTSPSWPVPGFVTMDLTEVQASVGALYRWTKYFSIYGGPVFTYSFGEFETDFVDFDSAEEGGLFTSQFKWDIESKSDFGVYLGTQILLDKNFSLNMEYQITGNAQLYGASVVWRF